MTSVGAPQMRAFVMLDLWINSCPIDKICHFKQEQRNMLLRGHLYHSYITWSLWFTYFSSMSQTAWIFYMPLSKEECPVLFCKLWHFAAIYNAEGHKHTKKQYLQITEGCSAQEIQLLNIKSCLESMRSKVKNEKMTGRCGLQTAPSLELYGKADDTHHHSPVRVIGVRV